MTLTPPLDHVPAEGWRDLASCRGDDTEKWFPARGIGVKGTEALKAICASCPVQVDCLTTALDDCEKFGFFGGTSERDRRKMRQSWPRRACAFCRTPIPHNPRAGGPHPTCERCQEAATAKDRMDAARRAARYRLWDARPTIHDRAS